MPSDPSCPSWCEHHDEFGNELVHHSAVTSVSGLDADHLTVEARFFDGRGDPDLDPEPIVVVGNGRSTVAQLTPLAARVIGAALIAAAELSDPGLRRRSKRQRRNRP